MNKGATIMIIIIIAFSLVAGILIRGIKQSNDERITDWWTSVLCHNSNTFKEDGRIYCYDEGVIKQAVFGVTNHPHPNITSTEEWHLEARE